MRVIMRKFFVVGAGMAMFLLIAIAMNVFISSKKITTKNGVPPNMTFNGSEGPSMVPTAKPSANTENVQNKPAPAPPTAAPIIPKAAPPPTSSREEKVSPPLVLTPKQIVDALKIEKAEENSQFFFNNNFIPVVPASSIKLTEQEVFDKIWPPVLRESLGTVEDVMVKLNFIGEADRSKILIDDDMYAALRRIALFERLHGGLDEQKYQIFLGVLDRYPEKVRERRAELMGGTARDTRPVGTASVFAESKKSLLNELVEAVKYGFWTIQEARATWYLYPDCYKDDNPYYSVPGFSIPWFSCNDGWIYCGYSLCYVPDCSQQSAACDIPTGCLNLICMEWPNAIWDAYWNPPLVSLECGCG